MTTDYITEYDDLLDYIRPSEPVKAPVTPPATPKLARVRPLVARIKVYFFRGWAYAQLPAIGLTAAYALEAKFGIPFRYSITFGIILCIIVGAFDFTHGIAREENNLAWDLTPRAMKVCDDIAEIKEMLKK